MISEERSETMGERRRVDFFLGVAKPRLIYYRAELKSRSCRGVMKHHVIVGAFTVKTEGEEPDDGTQRVTFESEYENKGV